MAFALRRIAPLAIIALSFAGGCAAECRDPQGCLLEDPNGSDRDAGEIDGGSITSDAAAPSRPVAVIDALATASVGEHVVFDGSSSSSPQGEPLEFRWTLRSKPAASSAMIGGSGTRVGFRLDAAGTYSVELVVVARSGASEPARAQLTAIAADLRLERIVEGGPWVVVSSATGIAVDRADRVFLMDHDAVYVIEQSTVSTYLTRADAARVGGSTPDRVGFADLDVDADGVLYVLTTREVLTSTAAHEATVLRPMLPDMEMIGVVDRERIALVSTRIGLWSITPTAQAQVYDAATLGASPGCATRDFAIARSGVFLFQPGCLASPMIRGELAGTNVGVLFPGGDTTQGPGLHAFNFLCTTHDPEGGFYAMIEAGLGQSSIELFHVDEEETIAYQIAVRPSFDEARSSAPFGFRYCSIAVGPTGAIYLQVGSELWRIDR